MGIFNRGDVIRRDVDQWLGTFEVMGISDTTIMAHTYANIRNTTTNYTHKGVCLGEGPSWVLYTPLKPVHQEMNHRMIDSITRYEYED
jgi:hypothetical protein